MNARGDVDSRLERAIDSYLAVYDVRTSHAIEVDAPPDVTYRAVRELDLGRSLPIMALFAVRAVPHVLTGKARLSRSLTMASFLETGFSVLYEWPPEEFVMGAVGKFWRPDSGFVRIAPEDFLGFDEPGYAKAALSFTIDEHARGSLLATETRVACTDASARRKFSMYWRVVGPFSGLIRHLMLQEVKNQAENG